MWHFSRNFLKNIFFKHKSACIVILVCVVLSVLFIIFFTCAQQVFQNTETKVRFGIIGDIEYGKRHNVGNKLTKLAATELEKAVNFYNEQFSPIFLIEMGDMIESSGIGREKAKNQLRFINDIFTRAEARPEYVLGNHDLRALSKEQFRTVLGLADNHRYFDEGAWRFVIMDTNFDQFRDGAPMGPNYYVKGFVPESEFVWLEEALATDRPTILFSHHPITFGEKNVVNFLEVKDFLSRYPNVVLSVSGHDPAFRFSEDRGIYYLVVDNLANKDSIGSFATIEARYNSLKRRVSIDIEHYGPTRRSLTIEKIFPGQQIWWMGMLEKLGIV